MRTASIFSGLFSSRQGTLGLFGLFILLVLASDVMGQKTRPYYHEDLYSLRPKLDEPVDSTAQREKLGEKRFVAATGNVNEKVDDVLDSINRFNITRKFIEGYTIQIYSGQNREEAMNAKKKMTEVGLNGALEYTQPKFRVRYGNYYSRLEAQKDLTRLKKNFPNAILVPEKILVR
ncbi:MAG: SPOR domain-containing protein [Cyclobacteriaceae bacterium]|nr:SPOR domain-containing protein [Cyclobacteriaceae bacterium]